MSVVYLEGIQSKEHFPTLDDYRASHDTSAAQNSLGESGCVDFWERPVSRSCFLWDFQEGLWALLR